MYETFLDFIKLFKDISTPIFYIYIFIFFILFQLKFNKKTLFIYYKMYISENILFKSLFKLVFKQILFITLLNGLFLLSLYFTKYELSVNTIPFIIFFIISYNLFMFLYHNLNLLIYVCYKHRKDIFNAMIRF